MKKILDLTCLDADYTRKLNDIALNCKREYTEFVDQYSRKHGHFYLWWALPFSSRNIYLDDTFQNICYLQLCVRAIYDDSEVNHIIVANKALYDSLLLNYKQELSKKKIVLENVGKKVTISGTIINMFRQFIKQIKVFFRIKMYLGSQKYNIEDSISLIDTPLVSSCFNNGKYEDRYFNDIQKYIQKKIYYLPSLVNNSSMNWKEFVNSIKKSPDYKFLLKEKFLTIFDYFFVIEYFVYCLMLSTRKYEYGKLNVAPLIRESMLKGSYCVPSIKGILNNRFIKHFKKTNIRVENLISWYEGRPSEIMLQSAFRKAYPNSRSVGYIGYPYFELALSEYISEEQYNKKAAPLKMTVPGAIYEKQTKQFCDKVKLIRAPILRNRYKNVTKQASSKKQILVILPYYEEFAGKMLHVINEYMRIRKGNVDIIVKNHPIHKGKTVDWYIKEELYFVPQYVEGELIHCLHSCSLAYLSYSTASLEVLSQGVFLVNLCPAGKLRNTGIPDGIDRKRYRIVYDEKETFEAFDFYLCQRIKWSDELSVADLLEPINEDTIGELWA